MTHGRLGLDIDIHPPFQNKFSFLFNICCSQLENRGRHLNQHQENDLHHRSNNGRAAVTMVTLRNKVKQRKKE